MDFFMDQLSAESYGHINSGCHHAEPGVTTPGKLPGKGLQKMTDQQTDNKNNYEYDENNLICRQ